MRTFVIYLAGLFTGIAACFLLYFYHASSQPIYTTNHDLLLALGSSGEHQVVLPAQTRLTHQWSASEGFEQFCLSVNLEGYDQSSVAKSTSSGTFPYWIRLPATQK